MLLINTITDTNSVRAWKVNGLHIQDNDHQHNTLKISFAYSQDRIPTSHKTSQHQKLLIHERVYRRSPPHSAPA